MSTRIKRNYQRRHRQHGMVLIVTLIMLMMLTTLGVITLKASTSEERIASNLRERQLVFEYAESALRWCQDNVRNNTFSGTVAARPTGNEDPNLWSSPSNWTDPSNRAVVSAPSIPNVTTLCMVEKVWLEISQVTGGSLRESRTGYRATVRARRDSGGTQVMLQSVFPSN